MAEEQQPWIREMREREERRALLKQQKEIKRKSFIGRMGRVGKTISKLRRSRVAIGPVTSAYRAVAPSRLGKKPFGYKKTKYRGKKGYRGRGRPRRSYKYFIPGKGPVSVFEWRKHLSQQKQLMKMRLQQMRVQQQGVYSPYQQQALQQQIQQQMIQKQRVAPVQQGRMPPAMIQEPAYEQYPSDLKIWEDIPGVGLNPAIQQQPHMFYERDLATGQMKLRKGGSFL